MTPVLKVMRYSVADLVRSRSALAYAGFFGVTAWSLFHFGEEPSQAIVSLLSLVLLVIPLVSVVFGMTHFYGAREFMELLLVQPVDRGSVYWGHYLGLSVSLVLAYVAGLLGPFLWYGLQSGADAVALAALLGAGALLTLIFVGLAFFVALRTENRLKALGAAVLLWLAFAVMYDGLVLVGAMAFQDYPLETPLIGLMLLNPLDLARVLILLRLDVAALMGYTGAVFQAFFGSAWGSALALLALGLWTVVPALAGLRAYRRKDF
ncbi:MAG: ABC transporter permease subunit [Candidatus Rokubacteria bacterium]|nr:ABC transporter permease subunit [Candidatus Rokubacteria bacterium]